MQTGQKQRVYKKEEITEKREFLGRYNIFNIDDSKRGVPTENITTIHIKTCKIPSYSLRKRTSEKLLAHFNRTTKKYAAMHGFLKKIKPGTQLRSLQYAPDFKCTGKSA